MKRIISFLMSIIFIVCSFSIIGFAESGGEKSVSFLHTEGESIFNESGEQIVLRGTNFGGWGIMEDWFCPFVSPSGE